MSFPRLLALLFFLLGSSLIQAAHGQSRTPIQAGPKEGLSTITILDDESRAPLAGAVVYLMEEGSGWRAAQGRLPASAPDADVEALCALLGRSAFTNPSGQATFEFVQLPADVVVIARDGRAASRRWKGDDASSMEVRIEETTATEVRVVDKEGAPVEGAWIRWSNIGRSRLGKGPRSRARTNAEGVARLVATKTDRIGLWKKNDARIVLDWPLATTDDAMGVRVSRRPESGAMPTIVMPRTTRLNIAATDRESIVNSDAPRFIWISDSAIATAGEGGIFRAFRGNEQVIVLPFDAYLHIGVGWSGLPKRLAVMDPLQLRKGANGLSMDPADGPVFRGRALAAGGRVLRNTRLHVRAKFGSVSIRNPVRTDRKGAFQVDGESLDRAQRQGARSSASWITGNTNEVVLQVSERDAPGAAGTSQSILAVGTASLPAPPRPGLHDFGDVVLAVPTPIFAGTVRLAAEGDIPSTQITATVKTRRPTNMGLAEQSFTFVTKVAPDGSFSIADGDQKLPSDGDVLSSELFFLCDGVDDLVISVPPGTLDMDIELGGAHTLDIELEPYLAEAVNLFGVLSSEEQSFEGSFVDGRLRLERIPRGTYELRVMTAGLGTAAPQAHVADIVLGVIPESGEAAGLDSRLHPLRFEQAIQLLRLGVQGSDGSPVDALEVQLAAMRPRYTYREQMMRSRLTPDLTEGDVFLDLSDDGGFYGFACPVGAELKLRLDAQGHLPQPLAQVNSDLVVDLQKAHTVELHIKNWSALWPGSPYFTFELLDPLPGDPKERFAQGYDAPGAGISGAGTSRLLIDLPRPGRYAVEGHLRETDPASGKTMFGFGSHGTVEVPAGDHVVLTFDIKGSAR